MNKKCWNLCYVAGNPAHFTQVTKDATSPMTRADALESAQTVAQNGWRVWVEHTERPERIFESYQEIAFRTGAAPGSTADSSTPGTLAGHAPAPAADPQASLQLAATLWWESIRPLGYSLQAHFANPGVNTTSEAQRHLAHAVAAFLKASVV